MDRSDRAGPRRKLGAVSIATLVVLSSLTGVLPGGIGVVSAANSSTIEGTPQLNASAPDARLNPGQNGAVGITITNDATYDDNNATHPSEARSRAGEARSVSLDISDTRGAPLSVETGSQSIGTVQDGESSGPHSFNVVVDEDAAAGTYEMEVTTEYRHAEQVTYEEVADGEYAYNETVVTRTETDTITVVIEPEARFEVDNVDHDVPLGGEGTVILDITNTGDEDVTETAVSVTSSDSNFYFGSGTATSEANVGDWDAGETKQLEFRAGTVESAVKREYPVDVSVRYTDSDGTQQSSSEPIGVTPQNRTRFNVVSVTHDVPRSGEGTLSVTVNQTAGKTIEDVAVTASTTATEVYLGSESSRSSRTFLDNWEGGEETTFTFRVGTTENAINRSYPIELQFEYTDADDNDNARSSFLEFTPEKSDPFNVSIADHDVPQNGEGIVTFSIRNTRKENFSDVTITTASSDSTVTVGGSSSQSATTVIEQWESGERRTVTARVGTAESAVERAYPLDATIEYTDAANNDNSQTDTLEFVPDKRDFFAVDGISHTVPENGEGTLSINVTQVANKSFEDVMVTASTTAPDVYLGAQSSRSSTTTVDTWNRNGTQTLTFRVGTTESAVDRPYPIDLEFDFTDANDNDNTRTKQLEFTPGDREQFEIGRINHDIPVNGEGTIDILARQITNKTIEDVTVTASTTAPDVYLGAQSSRSSTTTIDTWSDKAAHEFTFRVGTTDAAVEQAYPIQLQFEYTDGEDNDNSRTKIVDFTPESRDRFETEIVNHDVPRGGEGTVTIELDRIAASDVSDVSVTARTTDSTTYLGTESSASATTTIGTLKENENEEIQFRVGTSDSAVERPYTLDLTIDYTGSENSDNQRTKSVEFIPQDADHLSVEEVNHNVPRDGEGTATFIIVNTASKTLEDVSLTASSTDSEMYLGAEASQSGTTVINEWNPSETKRVTFRVGTTENAVDRTYPIDLQFEYTDETDNQNSRNKQVEIRPQAKEHLSIHAVEHNVPIDGVGQVTVLANNTADRNFSDLSVTASTPDSEVYIGSESSRSGTATVSEWAAGQARSITFQVGTSANAVNRSYPLDLEFEYSDAADNNNQYTDDIEFRPRSEPQFTVQSIDHEVPIGSTGQVTLTVRNEGPVNASETTLTIGSNTDAVYFGAGGTPEPIEAQGVVLEPPRTGTPTAQSHVGNWSVGETKTVSFRVGFDENAITRRYAAELSVSYENENGDDMPDRTKMVGIEPLAEQLFDFAAVESDLHVGEEGNLVGEIENVGNRSVEGVVVTAETQRETVNFYNARYAVGELEPGESERFRHRVGITNEAEHGPRLFEVSARYRDSQGDIQTTDSRDLTVAFGRDRDAFGLDTDATFEPGASGTLDVTVTNRRNETLSNVQAKLFTDDPLDSEDDSAFVPELAPGESTTVTLDLSVGGGASAKTYSASMDFRYDNARGESTLSDTYRVPVVVAQPESGMGLPVLIGGLGVVIVVGIAGWRFGAVDRLRDRIGEWRTDSAGPADVQE
ncbi:hypothetical protein Hrd1104_06695 [Halorhabdus sp. CBA1104]|uniref:COG1361 S-layer family protein n=1 Tax=Halorhabdus sp. CBA1104 TaxID=1380432 RepID=UPI0012B3F7A0|nr:hypothetical protein [Halorhabdus sp. CBA1104]QGN07012.1 hypothetical protein Hrd1104_06695 [Halorhabdus sp. CBA1104]